MVNTFPEGSVREEKVPAKKEFSITNEYLLSVEKLAAERMSRKVKIKAKEGTGKGKLVLDYHSSADLEEILTALCGEDFVELLDR